MDLATAGIYFVFGLIGTLCRVGLSPTMEFGVNRRTIIEGIIGGVAGFLLPYFGVYLGAAVGIDPKAVGEMPTIIKGGLVCILSFTGSFSVGEIIARQRGVN